jgi:hypothetical protein
VQDRISALQRALAGEGRVGQRTSMLKALSRVHFNIAMRFKNIAMRFKKTRTTNIVMETKR